MAENKAAQAIKPACLNSLNNITERRTTKSVKAEGDSVTGSTALIVKSLLK